MLLGKLLTVRNFVQFTTDVDGFGRKLVSLLDLTMAH